MKDEPIKIPITIETVYKYAHDDRNEFHREQIEHAQLYLSSVFNFIKHSATNLQDEFQHDEDPIIREFCYDLKNFCEIGNGLLSAIWKNVSDMDFETGESIAEKISFLISSENVPSQITEALEDGLTELYNDARQTEITALEKSPEYIAKLLRDHGQTKV